MNKWENVKQFLKDVEKTHRVKRRLNAGKVITSRSSNLYDVAAILVARYPQASMTQLRRSALRMSLHIALNFMAMAKKMDVQQREKVVDGFEAWTNGYVKQLRDADFQTQLAEKMMSAVADQYLDMVTDGLGLHWIRRAAKCSYVTLAVDWALNMNGTVWSCPHCGLKYSPTSGTSDEKTSAQKVLAVRSNKMAKLSAFGQDTMVLPETRPDGTEGDLWNFSLCVWEDANLTNLLARIKAICHNITERFANKEAESIKGDLVRIAMASMPGYFKKFSVDEAYVLKYEEEQKWRNNKNHCYLPQHVVDAGAFHSFHFDQKKFPHILNQDDLILLMSMARAAMVLADLSDLKSSTEQIGDIVHEV